MVEQAMHMAASPHPVSWTPRVYFVQALVLGAGVPEMTQAQCLHLEPHRPREPNVTPGPGYLAS